MQIGPDGERDQMRFYNGFVESEFATATGLTKLGIEKLHPIVARGILLDFAGARGVESMNKGECASMDDVKAALEKQGMADFEFMEGDAILFRYGWESHWDDPATFNDGQPGICMDVARWVAEEVKAGVTGGDTWAATDPVPYPDEPALRVLRPPVPADAARHRQSGEPDAQAARRRRRVRVHLRLQPGADHRRDRLDRSSRSRSTERRRTAANGAASVRARPFSLCRRARRARAGIGPSGSRPPARISPGTSIWPSGIRARQSGSIASTRST